LAEKFRLQAIFLNARASALPFVLIMFHLRGMRVAQDRLILVALAVLHRAHLDTGKGSVRPGSDVRLALAVLFGLSRSGERERYDRFWRNLSEPYPTAFSESAGNVWRMNEAHCLFESIARDVGAPADMGYRAKIGDLVSGRPARPWRPGSAFSPSHEQA
jgi:hypothetical protein